MKGSKIHVAVTPQCLPIAIDLGSGNEHESRKLIPLLNDIQIKNNNGRPRSRPERIWADTKYHTFLVPDISLQQAYWSPNKRKEECQTETR